MNPPIPIDRLYHFVASIALLLIAAPLMTIAGADIGDTNEIVVAEYTVNDPGGRFHNVYVHALPSKLRKRAKDCLSNSKDALQADLKERMGKQMTGDAIQKEEISIDHAQVLKDADFEKKFENDSETFERRKKEPIDGYTDSSGSIWLRQSSWNKATDYHKAKLLAHEGLHVILLSSAGTSLQRPPPEVVAKYESKEDFINGFLKRQCFPK